MVRVSMVLFFVLAMAGCGISQLPPPMAVDDLQKVILNTTDPPSAYLNWSIVYLDTTGAWREVRYYSVWRSEDGVQWDSVGFVYAQLHRWTDMRTPAE
jgi:hypothetical protein